MPSSIAMAPETTKGANRPGGAAPWHEWLSPAKVNLWLLVTGRRADGYHLLDSLMVPVDLCDRLRLSVKAQRPGQPPAISLSCNDPTIPNGAQNLAWRAAELLLAEVGCSASVSIELDKVLPAGAGLGGGSSNAGTVLRALNHLLGLKLSRCELVRIAVRIGADVPFFVSCNPSRIKGIGEVIRPVSLEKRLQLVIAVPPVRVNTAWAFAQFDRSLTRQNRARNLQHFENLEWSGAGSMVNDLEEAVMAVYPEIRAVKKALLDAGASGAVMSGSGSAVVGLVGSEQDAAMVADRIRSSTTCEVYSVSNLLEPPAGSGVAA